MIYTAVDTFYLTQEQLQNSPSRKDGVDEETEAVLRLFGCELVQEGGILLKLPQAVMATGQVLFHRFFCKKSFSRFNAKRVAASCLWLAAKLEESPRRIQHILNVFHRMECRRENKSLELLDPSSKRYEEMRVDLIRTERHLLKEMGFICHVEHPHKFIISYLLQLQAPQELMQEAWNMANDSLRTTLSVRFKSEVVACGVVYAAARRFKFNLPENPPWWKAFDAEKDDVEEVCRVLALLFKQPKANYVEVSRDSKSFVLISRAWDPPPNLQDCLAKSTSLNGTKAGLISSADMNARESIVKAALDKLKNSFSLESRKPDDGAIVSIPNGGDSQERVKSAREKEDVIVDREGVVTARVKGKEKDRSKSREKDRDWEKELPRESDMERVREWGKDKAHRSKVRSKDSGRSEKGKHHGSSRERDYHKIGREKERRRHHPYT